ncbi:MAG: hypothetical protein WKF77_08685 [Planctomycetaceae bacterium]
MAKKKSKKRAATTPPSQTTPVELQALLDELGIPQGDPASMALLQSLVQSSGVNVGELFASLLPELDEADNTRPPEKKPGRKSKSSKSKSRGRSTEDLDDLVESALSGQTPEKTLAMLETAVKIGEEQLAADFRDHVGHFWLLSETRPYMRARLQLVHVLLAQGDPKPQSLTCRTCCDSTRTTIRVYAGCCSNGIAT